MSDPSETLKDIDGHLSSKRALAFISLFALIGCLVADVFGHAPPDYIVHSFTFITASGMGFAASERFAPRNQ